MAETIHDQVDLVRLRAALSIAFTPSGPVNDPDLFAGRLDQIAQAVSAVSQVGQHAIIYGERGVGKTSLASLVHEFWSSYARDRDGVLSARYNCDPTDTFGSIWASLAEIISDLYEKRGETTPTGESWQELYAEIRNGEASPNSVRRLLDLTGKRLIIVVDEFDQVRDEETIRLFASTIKALSDHLVDTTLILVGIGDTVGELLIDHASIDRALAQILMPRMSTGELTTIIEHGYERVGIKVDDGVIDLMGKLAQGLPHYAHRFGQEAGYAAVDRKSGTVTKKDVEKAVSRAIALTHESVATAYQYATKSPQKEALFKKVLLACALAKVDGLGYFAAGDVRAPLSEITGRQYEIAEYLRHLRKFSGPERGPVLQVVGEDWGRRYRFISPVLRPYVVLKGIEEGLITEEAVASIESLSSNKSTEAEQKPLL